MNQSCPDVFAHYNLPFETYFDKGLDHQFQVHDEVELVWVLRGDVDIVCEKKEFKLSSQMLFMINPYQIHSIKSTDDSMIITFRFKKKYLLEYSETYKGLVFENKINTFDDLAKKYKEVPLLISQLISLLITPNQSSLVRYKIIGYYNMFIYELYTMLLKEKYLDIKKKDIPFHIERQNKIIDYLNKNFLTRITLDELAGKIGISSFRLSHLMKEMFGISFREYLFNIRLEYALGLLRETNYSVLKVSKMSGFSDIKYLNKRLKERFKTTALKYRKKYCSRLNNTVSDCTYIDDFSQELRVCIEKMSPELNLF